VTITEPREANIKILSLRYPEETVLRLDLEHPQELPGAPFDVVHCNGTLPATGQSVTSSSLS
jgi:hypothetical protein